MNKNQRNKDSHKGGESGRGLGSDDILRNVHDLDIRMSGDGRDDRREPVVLQIVVVQVDRLQIRETGQGLCQNHGHLVADTDMSEIDRRGDSLPQQNMGSGQKTLFETTGEEDRPRRRRIVSGGLSLSVSLTTSLFTSSFFFFFVFVEKRKSIVQFAIQSRERSRSRRAEDG
jgi:hypothetical protein